MRDEGVQNRGDERTPDKREKIFQLGILNHSRNLVF
jgi:hypothetical protein